MTKRPNRDGPWRREQNLPSIRSSPYVFAAGEQAMRQIRDAAGVEWMVYEVNPGTNQWPSIQSLPEGYRSGWLCFESAMEKRRLTPPPSGWQNLPAEQLSGLIRSAVPVRRPAKPSIQEPRTP
jgi:hypothetical protein